MEKAALKFVLKKYKLFRASEMVTNDAPVDFDNRRLQQLIDAIKARFGRYISEWEAEELDAIASKFIGKIDKQTKAGLMANLKKAGIVIDFHISALHQPLLEEMVASNVNLIKSIAPKYFDKLTNVVIDSALKGRDMASIFQHIKDLNKVTERRAELIAIDQTNKATQALNVMQTKDIGIKKGIWIHIPGEKSSRKTHIAMNGKTFDLDEGLYDEDVGRNVLPGELPYCRCDFRPDITELLTNEQ
jgi:SPP1 gp7 family putative phage head morphogenesis protein